MGKIVRSDLNKTVKQTLIERSNNKIPNNFLKVQHLFCVQF